MGGKAQPLVPVTWEGMCYSDEGQQGLVPGAAAEFIVNCWFMVSNTLQMSKKSLLFSENNHGHPFTGKTMQNYWVCVSNKEETRPSARPSSLLTRRCGSSTNTEKDPGLCDRGISYWFPGEDTEEGGGLSPVDTQLQPSSGQSLWSKPPTTHTPLNKC